MNSTGFPFLLERQTVPAANIDIEQGAGHCIEAGREDNHVEFKRPRADTEPRRGKTVDRGFADIHFGFLRCAR